MAIARRGVASRGFDSNMIRRLLSLLAGRSRKAAPEQWSAEPLPGSGAEEQKGSPASHSGTAAWLKSRMLFGELRLAASLGPFRMAAALAVACGLLGALGFLALAPQKADPSRLARVPNIDSTPGGQRQRVSPSYRETLRTANVSQAAEADRTGASFVSIPEGLPEQTRRPRPPSQSGAARDGAAPDHGLSDADFQAAQRIALAAGRSAANGGPSRSLPHSEKISDAGGAVPASHREPADNPFHAAILRQMNAISRGMAVPEPVSVELIADANDPDMAWAAQSADGSAAARPEQPPPAAIAAGTVFEAETVSEVDSDVPAPVAVRVRSGPAAGSILIGGFQTNSLANGFVMEFGTLVTPTGRETAVRAVAVDLHTRGFTVASEVQARPIQRFGPMLVSSLVSGFAANASRPALTLFTGANGVIAATEKSGLGENLAAGAGQAAAQASAEFAANAPKTARIRLFAGEPVGIMFLTPVSGPEFQQEQ